MNSVSEITVKISNTEQKYTQSFLEYEPLVLSHDDPKLKEYVDQAVANFKGKPENIVVKVKYVWE